jgi:nitroreductase
MEFQDVVRRRKMVRNYTTDPVDPALVDLALRNAVRAPNAGFSQGWAFLVLDRPDDVRRFWAATADDLDRPDQWLTGMMKAPVVILPCSSKAAYLDRYAQPDKGWADRDETRWPKPFWDMDTAMAALLILQTATDAGLGSCFIGLPAEKEPDVRAEFSIPDEFDPVGVVTIGHPAATVGAKGSPTKRSRKPMDGLVHRGGWGHTPSPSA